MALERQARSKPNRSRAVTLSSTAQYLQLLRLKIFPELKSVRLSTRLEIKAFIRVLGSGITGANNFVFPSLAEMMTAVECWRLHSTSRCLSMTAECLFVAEWKIRIVGEEGDWSQLAKALEESELEAEFDGRSLGEDIVNCCKFVRTHDLQLSAHPFPWI